MPGLADVAVAPSDCIQDALAYWLKRFGAHAVQGLDPFIADYGSETSKSA